MLNTLTSMYGAMYAPRLTARVTAILNDRKGVSAMEYAVLAVAIVVAVGAAATALSGAFSTAMGTVTATVTKP